MSWRKPGSSGSRHNTPNEQLGPLAENLGGERYVSQDEKDVKELNDKLDSGLDTKKLDVGMNKAQYTNESTRRLFKKFLNRK